MDPHEVDLQCLELQHPDGRWLPHSAVEIVDAYWA
jgi:hypothetical protein